jgi:LysR family transcriptional regulator, transcriptional activator for dmlA
MDLINAVACFVRVAERGSFSASARDMGVSQAHMSRAIAQLEARLGTKLIHRTTRQLTLTDEGMEYLGRCRTILSAIEEADQSVGKRANVLSGQLRVFAPVSLGRTWIVPRVTEFLARHPDLSIKLVLDDSPRDLIEDRLDIGLRIGPLSDGTQQARKLGDIERVIVATPAYWDQSGRPNHPSDLEGHEWLMFDGVVLVNGFDCMRGDETLRVHLKGRFSSNSSEAMQEAMLTGAGVCLAPYWLAAKGLSDGSLERVFADWRTMPSLPLYVTYPANRAPTEKVRRFIDWLVYCFHADGHFLKDQAV